MSSFVSHNLHIISCFRRAIKCVVHPVLQPKSIHVHTFICPTGRASLHAGHTSHGPTHTRAGGRALAHRAHLQVHPLQRHRRAAAGARQLLPRAPCHVPRAALAAGQPGVRPPTCHCPESGARAGCGEGVSVWVWGKCIMCGTTVSVGVGHVWNGCGTYMWVCESQIYAEEVSFFRAI